MKQNKFNLQYIATKKIEKNMNSRYSGKDGRQRNRHEVEKETLKRWEKERKGVKIGTI